MHPAHGRRPERGESVYSRSAMKSSARTVTEYLKELPAERKKGLQRVRNAIRESLPAGYKEIMQYGMISYVVPLTRYPDGYLGKSDTPVPFVSLASQKNHMAIYMMCVYGEDEEEFRRKYLKTGLKLDMGKCCLRFRNLEELALDTVCEEIASWPVHRFLAKYEEGRGNSKSASAGRPSRKAKKSGHSPLESRKRTTKKAAKKR